MWGIHTWASLCPAIIQAFNLTDILSLFDWLGFYCRFLAGRNDGMMNLLQRCVNQFSWSSPTGSLKQRVLRGTAWALAGYGASQLLYVGSFRSPRLAYCWRG